MEKANKPMSLGRVIFAAMITILFFPAVILLLSDDWLWLEGWIFSLWLVVMVLSNLVYLYWKDPALLAERSKAPGSDNQKQWDKYLIIVIYVWALAWLIIMPLDAKRFGWSPMFPVWLKVLGGVALLPALYLIYQATVENTYLSTLVRIQSDRKHHVISTGVYGFVRHPLYLGCMLMCFGAPLLLGSLYGFIVAFIGLILIIGRIIGEEKVLTNELEGYDEYQKKVKYRLVPFVW
jgi:protein-S-isoprenylcysteine O-methyltransferase Ste14